MNLKIWSEVIQKHQIDVFKTTLEANGLTARLCFFRDKNFTIRGAGKGLTSEGMDLSASYEALELYFSGINYFPSTHLLATTLEIKQNFPIILNRCNKLRFMDSSNQSISIPWVVYENISTAEKHAVPLASVDLSYSKSQLTNDTFPYSTCQLFAASNGLASEVSYEKSVIHGTLELLERDACSYFLIDTFLLNKPLTIVNHSKLPYDLQDYIQQVETKLENSIVIIKLPSRFGVEAYLATFLNQEFEIQARGSGASLNAREAVERALCELTQTYVLTNGDYYPKLINQQLCQNVRLIQKMLQFDIKSLLDRGHYSQLDFYDNSTEISSLSTLSYLNKLITIIEENSASLLVNTVYTDENELTCTRVIIPEAEEFFLAQHYQKVALKKHADLYIESHLGQKFSWNSETKLKANN